MPIAKLRFPKQFVIELGKYTATLPDPVVGLDVPTDDDYLYVLVENAKFEPNMELTAWYHQGDNGEYKFSYYSTMESTKPCWFKD